jgi:hypothetical protein
MTGRSRSSALALGGIGVALAGAFAFGAWHVVVGGGLYGNARAAEFGAALAAVSGAALARLLLLVRRLDRRQAS